MRVEWFKLLLVIYVLVKVRGIFIIIGKMVVLGNEFLGGFSRI